MQGVFMRALILGLILAVCQLQAMPPDVRTDLSGRMKIAGLDAHIVCYNAGWQYNEQGKNSIVPLMSYPVPGDKVYELQGTFRLKNGQNFYLQQFVREVSPDTAGYSVFMKSESPVSVQSLSYNINLPAHRFSGKNIRIDGRDVPLKPGNYKNVKMLEISCLDRVIAIQGDFPLTIADNRKFSVPAFGLRLGLAPAYGKIDTAKQKFSIQVRSRDLHMFELAQASGSGKLLRDREAVSFARKLKLNSGTLTRGGLRFSTPDWKRTEGTILVLGPGESLRIPAKNAERNFYLLQNADSKDAVPILNLVFKDGSKQRFQLKSGVDFDVSKPLKRLPNGALCVSDDKTFFGLYFSAFTAEKQGIAAVELANEGKGRWYIAAITASSGTVRPSTVASIKYMVPDRNWLPFENVQNVVPGSILDFSKYTDAPAGKYGWISIDKKGHFVAEKRPEKRIRFLGANLVTTGQVQDKKNADELADNLAKMGYNTVRFHHFERYIVDPKGTDSKVFDPGKLDKMEYLFAALKKRGIYMTLDLYCSRAVKPQELGETARKNFKSLILTDRNVYENYRQFVRKLLNHKNPYTGMTWAEDPALYAVCLANESAPYQLWSKCEQEFQNAYNQYLRKKGIDTPENRRARDAEFYRFLREINIDFVRNATDFLRKEIRYRGLITHLNHRQHLLNCDIREHLDFVDNHTYWDHPNFLPGSDWSLPRLHNQMSAIHAGAWNPRTLMPSRIFGKPFTVTENNFTFPNRYRAEGGPLLGGYAALQDWDGLYRFAWWSHLRETRLHEAPINGFDIAEDSNAHLAERLMWALFLRGDAAPAREAVAWSYGESVLKNWKSLADAVYPVDYQALGFHVRIGSLNEKFQAPGVRLLTGNPREFRKQLSPALQKLYNAPVHVSDTGEIIYEPDRFRIITPKTESLALFKGNADGHVLQVRNADSFQVISAISMDGKPLAQSGEILLFHQSDVVNTYLRYSSESENAVESWGVNKPLIRKANADVTLSLAPADYTVHAVGLNGLPKQPIPAVNVKGTLRFKADTSAFGGTMIYLIKKK